MATFFDHSDTGADPRPALIFLRWAAVTFVLLAGVNIALSLRFGAIEGDLARVGGFAERDYRPGTPQVAARIAPNTVELADADVIVLGDSFSNKLLWQGELEALTGQRTLTFQYGQAGCISNWLQWLHTIKLKPGATVVLESSERGFVMRYNRMPPCPKIVPVPVHRHLSVAGSKSWFDSDFSLDIVYQGRVLLNSMRLKSQDAYRAQAFRPVHRPSCRPAALSHRRRRQERLDAEPGRQCLGGPVGGTRGIRCDGPEAHDAGDARQVVGVPR